MNTNCLFCENIIFKKNLCRDHYTIMTLQKNDFAIQKENKFDLKDHFHNLRYCIIRQANVEHVIESSIRLIALAEACKMKYDDAKLVQEVYPFVKRIVIEKKINEAKTYEEKQKLINEKNREIDFRNSRAKEFMCEDGHQVRSQAELIIDNFMYYNKIVHVYEPICYLSEDKTLIADFYLPEYNAYIEYWGLYTKEYIARKHAKRELYKENNIALIEINSTDLRNISDYLRKTLISLKSQKK